MARVTSTVSVTLGNIDFSCQVNWQYVPGEDGVRYYPDGSGYPGSPPEFDCIDSVKVIDCVYLSGSSGDGWGYRDRDDLGDCAAVADRWCFDALSDGSYFDDLRLGTDIE